MESYNEAKLLARAMAGFKGGPYNNNPVPAPKLTFVEGYPPEYAAKTFSKSAPRMTVTDAWNQRRQK